jgi:competence protein ComEC
MTTERKSYKLLIFILVLLIIDSYLIHLDFKNYFQKNLTFAMLDIGQGDALFVESPIGTQIMFDAGPLHKILGPLSRVMSPFDKSIDAIVITNPDSDHIGGFLEILKNYKVDKVFEPGTVNDSKTFQSLHEEIRRQNIPDILVKRGMRLNLGGGAVIDILFPDRDVSAWSTNDGSVVARLSYGQTSLMLTGDATTKTEGIILNENPAAQLHSTILKVGHHGSHTSTSEKFVKAVAPKYALISDGKDNKYGHPHIETLDALNKFGAKIFRTDLLGTIIMKSDGNKESFEFIK